MLGRGPRTAAIPLALVAALLLSVGCEDSRNSPTGPSTGTRSPAQASQDGGATRVSKAQAVKDRFLFDHNASRNGGRTMRWATPIPVLFNTGDPEVDAFLLAQLVVWEPVLAPVTGTPLFAPGSASTSLSARGIHFFIGDLPPNVVGVASPTVSFLRPALSRRGSAHLAEGRPAGTETRRITIPEVLASGEIRRCGLVLDEDLAFLNVTVFQAVVRHELGHCLGFSGHVPSGLMRSTCCPMNITSDVQNMMRKLYSLPAGTEVTR